MQILNIVSWDPEGHIPGQILFLFFRGLLFTSQWLNLQHWTVFYIAVYGNFQGLFYLFLSVLFCISGAHTSPGTYIHVNMVDYLLLVGGGGGGMDNAASSPIANPPCLHLCRRVRTLHQFAIENQKRAIAIDLVRQLYPSGSQQNIEQHSLSDSQLRSWCVSVEDLPWLSE